MKATTPTARLLTIPFSHYCEKARWAADYTGLAYREEAYLPGAHMVPVRRAGGRTVPVLVSGDEVLIDSTDILRHVDARAPASRRLFPEDPGARREVEELEEMLDARLGPATRLYAYYNGLPDPRVLAKIVGPALSRGQRFFLPLMLRLVRGRIRRMYRINEESAAKAFETIHEVFALVGERLRQGGTRYLAGDRFGAADLTFASLAAVSLLPPGHPSFASDLEESPPELRTFVTALRETSAGQHALRMYREHRRT